MPTTQNVTFVFQDPAGNPIANGRVDIRLQQDISAALSGGPQVAAGITVSAALDLNGTAVGPLWANSMVATGTVYFVTAFSSLGQPVWSGQITVITVT